MIKKRPPSSWDPCLLPLRDAGGAFETERHLERLLQEARRTAHRLLHGVADGDTVEDLHGQVMERIVPRLLAVCERPDIEPIANFAGFVTTVAANVRHDYLNQRYPRRADLKRKLLYLLKGRTGHRGFAVWESPSGTPCGGFETWQGRECPATESYTRLVTDPLRFARRALPRADLDLRALPDLVAALFNRVGGPIAVNDLVAVVAALLGIKDELPQPLHGVEEEGEEAVRRDPRENPVATTVEQRDELRRLWGQIQTLDSRQCAALLLGPKTGDPQGVIALLELLDIAGLPAIAAALDMPVLRFAELSQELPLDDNTIAGLLRCTRQQVINLRSIARAKLRRLLV